MGTFALRKSSTASALRSNPADSLRLLDRTGLPPFQLYVGGTDIIAAGHTVEVDGATLVESGAGQPGELTFTVESSTFSPTERTEVVFEDNVVGRRAFSGFTTRRAVHQLYGSVAKWGLTVAGYDYLLDRTNIVSYSLPSSDDRTMLKALIADNSQARLYAVDGTVALTKTSVPAQTFTELTLRQAIEQIRDAVGTDRFYFIDSYGRLNYGLTGGPAPYVLSDAPTGSEVGYDSDTLSVEYDDGGIYDTTYVKGLTAAGTGWYTDPATLTAPTFESYLDESKVSQSAGDVATYGGLYIGKVGATITRGNVSVTGYDGWVPGQTLTLYNAALGLSPGSFTIVSVKHNFRSGTGLRTYEIGFGQLRKSLARQLATAGLTTI